MTHALDDLKQKPANELSLVECAILAADKAGEKNLAYRAADENNGMKIKNARAIDLLRAVNKTGGVVVEYYPASGNSRRPLRDWITEYLNEVDGKDVTK